MDVCYPGCTTISYHNTLLQKWVSELQKESRSSYSVKNISFIKELHKTLTQLSRSEFDETATFLLEETFRLTLDALWNDQLAPEAFPIAATCIVLALTALDGDRTAVRFSRALIWHDSDKEDIIDFAKIEPSLPLSWLLFGLFNADVDWLYSSNADTTTIYLLSLFPVLKKLCGSAGNFLQPAFQALARWITCARKFFQIATGNDIHSRDGFHFYLNDINDDELFCCSKVFCAKGNVKYCRVLSSGICESQQKPMNSDLPWIASKSDIFLVPGDEGSLYHLLNTNWENPTRGVPELVYECTKELFELHEDATPGHSCYLACNILNTLVDGNTWSHKRTYMHLKLALEFIPPEKILSDFPCVPKGLSSSLSANHLAPIGATVYKAIMKGLTWDTWKGNFITVFVNCLHDDDRLVRTHMDKFWLPPTLQQFPLAFPEFLQRCQDTDGGWVARMSLVQTARSIGLVEFWVEMEGIPGKEVKCCNGANLTMLVEEALCHADEAVRGHALSLLCHTKRTSQPVMPWEAEKLRLFYTWNSSVDSASFRHTIINSYKVLVARLRDACASELKATTQVMNLTKIDSLAMLLAKEFTTRPPSPILIVNGGLLLWLIRMFHQNLAPDGNYQRRILALRLYQETLLAFTDKAVTTGNSTACSHQRKAAVAALVAHICQMSLTESGTSIDVNFMQHDTVDILLNSCLDEMDDVRSESADVLHIVWAHTEVNTELTQRWLQLAVELCDSPKACDGAGGMTVIKLLAAVETSKNKTLKVTQNGTCIDILEFLSCRVEMQFARAKINLLEAASNSPVHGALLALWSCLCNGNCLLASVDVQKYVKRLSELCADIVDFILSRLSLAACNGSGLAPSFCEMSASINQIISQSNSNLECKNFDIELKNGNDGFCEDEMSDGKLSAEHLLVLSCCWQLLKECCRAASKCVEQWNDTMDEDTRRTLVERVIVRIMTGTRHIGALEAAREAYKQVCIVIMHQEGQGQLVCEQIHDLLYQLENGTGTSVTRRGAGASLMVQSACAAVTRGNSGRGNSRLVDDTVTTLLRIANKMSHEGIASSVDDPSTVAMHMLKALVSHSDISFHLHPHLPSITKTCLLRFTSNYWPLRNAALQLYAAVVPRLVGQKKVRSDDSLFNCLTASEFFCRHQLVSVQLLCHLKHCLPLGWSGNSDLCSVNLENLLRESSDPDKLINPMIDPKKLMNSMNGFPCNDDLIHSMDTELKLLEQPTCNSTSSNLHQLKDWFSAVPILSLLCRLSPGTDLHHGAKLEGQLIQYRFVITQLLASPVHTVRRLASQALVCLVTPSQVSQLVYYLMKPMVDNSYCLGMNQVNGLLMALLTVVQTYSIFHKQLRDFVKHCFNLDDVLWRCHPNKVILYQIILSMGEFGHIALPSELIVNCLPGVSSCKDLRIQLMVAEASIEEQRQFLEACVSDASYAVGVTDICLTQLIKLIEAGEDERGFWPRFEALLWLQIGHLNSPSMAFKLLHCLLQRRDVHHCVANDNIVSNLSNMLQNGTGCQEQIASFYIVSHLLVSVDLTFTSEQVINSCIYAYVMSLQQLSSPYATDKCRKAVCSAMCFSLHWLLAVRDVAVLSVEQRESVVVSCLNLLQDEDSDVRGAACNFVASLNGSTRIRHAALSLQELLEYVANRSSWTIESTISFLWQLCRGPLITLKGSNEENHHPKGAYLFQSHDLNMYKEPKQLSRIVSRLLVNKFSERVQSDSSHDWFFNWHSLAVVDLAQHGTVLTHMVGSCRTLIKDKFLAILWSVYNVCCELLCDLATVMSLPLPTFPRDEDLRILWNE